MSQQPTEFLAKGKRGIVHKTLFKNKLAVVKSVNEKSLACSRLKFEAELLRKLNKHKIGPKIYFYDETNNQITMEFIEGKRIIDFMETANREKIKKVIVKIIKQLYALDKLKINKKEMTNPYKHIIVKRNNPVLIDFERSKYDEKPSNITQFIQFLVSERIKKMLNNKGIKINKEVLLNIAGKYKKDYSEANLKRLVNEIQ